MMTCSQMGEIKTFRDFIKEVEGKGLLDAYYCGCSILVSYDEKGNGSSEVFSVSLCNEALSKAKGGAKND